MASSSMICAARGVPFTSAFHTRFPDYAAVRTGINAERFWPIMQRFHGSSRAVMAATPILLYVGRVSREKNLEAFLGGTAAGTKVVVGDGPALEDLKRRYPDAVFLGALSGEELACAYRSADCFVFPSRTDTFGLVVIEALACGVPVATYPVAGPIDLLGREGRGPDNEMPTTIAVLDEDFDLAITKALRLDRQSAAVFGAATVGSGQPISF